MTPILTVHSYVRLTFKPHVQTDHLASEQRLALLYSKSN